jgi:hypothetical protein
MGLLLLLLPKQKLEFSLQPHVTTIYKRGTTVTTAGAADARSGPVLTFSNKLMSQYSTVPHKQTNKQISFHRQDRNPKKITVLEKQQHLAAYYFLQ